MAKFCGIIGYAGDVETAPGVWEDGIVERRSYGDLIQNTRRFQAGETITDNINVANKISILADPYARDNFHNIRYVTFMGARWKVSEVEVNYPRLILTLGGLYHEPEA